MKGEDFRQIDTICLFRGDIEPTWEDSHNSNGGIHHLMLTDIGPEEMDNLWLQLSTCIVLNEDLKFANKVTKILKNIEKNKKYKGKGATSSYFFYLILKIKFNICISYFYSLILIFFIDKWH